MRRALVPLAALIALALPPGAAAQVGGPIGSPIVFRPKPGTTLTLEGRGPFRGALEVRREGGALTIVNEVSLEHYVMGVREVPGMWPMEALKAQAVAARTYVLWEIQKGYWKQFGFDVCGTTSCQVYQGATAELGERGKRWTDAVRATAGQVLLHDGEPALTRYHSSSGGRTLANEVVFPSDGARPYLRAVDDTFDEVSPLHRWKVSFKREHLQQILHDGVGLQGVLTDVTVDGRDIKIRTKGGELDRSTVWFRREISEQAPKSFPMLYPSARPDGEPMPFTLPSSRFTIAKAPSGGFVVNGIGYGHGVGMSQWGAMGRASDGQSYEEILAAYYGGLSPTRSEDQRTIRVAVVRGIGSALVSGNGAFSVTSAGQTLAASTLGGWATTTSGVRSIALSAPAGYTVPLALTGVRASDELIVDPPESGRTFDISFVVPKPAAVTAVLSREGAEVARGNLVADAGEHTLAVRLDPEKLAGHATYDVKLTAFDGTKTVRSSREVVLVRPSRGLWWKILLVVLFAAGVFWVRRRRALVGRRRSMRDRIVEPAGLR